MPAVCGTPVCDFIEGYRQRNPLRLHMPGHKGKGTAEALDITEIQGAPPLYPASGILRESEENAARLFGAGRTLFSAEGSSLCIRAMLMLARLRAEAEGLPPVLLAGRNAHQTFLTTAALLDLEVVWLQGDASLLTCTPSPEEVSRALDSLGRPPAAVWLTSPDYLGCRADIRGVAALCRARCVPLLVDNAHGAYLRFLPEDQHPLSLGADMTCDSAHKTLPVLTGGAWLQISSAAPSLFREQAERALAMFASTSPSWLILQSLDRCNALLSGDYRNRLAAFCGQTARLKERLRNNGWTLAGDEPLKITLAPRSFGYTGDGVHDILRGFGMECEFSDPDYLTMMVTPETGEEGLSRLEKALSSLPRKPALPPPPAPPPPEAQVLSLREALLSPGEEVPLDMALGRILAAPGISCPPAVPLLISGQRITEEALRAFRRYGIRRVSCVCEKKPSSEKR